MTDWGSVRYVADNKSFALLMVGPEMHTLSRAYADKAMAYAVKISPVGDRSDDADHKRYAESFEVYGDKVENLTTKRPTLRACADLVNTAPYAFLVEIGWRRKYASRGVAGKREGYHTLELTRSFIGDPIEPTGELG